MGVTAIVLAAGKGKRMKSPLPKVAHEIAGRPMLAWALAAVGAVEPDQLAVVVGHGEDVVRPILPPDAVPVEQASQRGTGDAARVAMEALRPAAGDTVLVVPGDAPLMTGATLRDLVDHHRNAGTAATIITTDMPAGQATGYGRILRVAGRLAEVVEEGDATPEQRAITEVNAGFYAFTAGALLPALEKLDENNVQGELYLTDVVGILADSGQDVGSVSAPPEVIAGVNTQEQLAWAAARVRRDINARWMSEGVAMLDPDRVYIDDTVTLAPQVRLYPGVHLEGDTHVHQGAEVGPDTHVRDSTIGAGAVVRYSVLDGASVGIGATVGPYARLRPGTVLGEQSKAGTFVEMKKTTVGARSKVPHLSYMGDATIGEDSNIGAGAITCNWDGFDKHPTVIGDRAFVGTNTSLVAPLEIGDDAWTGAGSVITRDVPDGALAVERSAQKQVPGYATRRRRRRRRSDQ